MFLSRYLHVLEDVEDVLGLPPRVDGVDLLGALPRPDVLVVRVVHNIPL